MSDILKVTTPLTGQENMGKVKPYAPNQTSIPNIPDPTRVTKPNSQTVFTERQAEKFAKNSASNFESFIQLLKNAPSLLDSFKEVYFFKLGNIVNSGISENFAQELSQFMDFLKMTDVELYNFIKSQGMSSSKFSGPFFDLLRQVINSNVPTNIKSSMLEFLKSYDNTTSSQHILNNMLANLKNMAANMPRGYGEKLLDLISKLSLSDTAANKSPETPSRVLLQKGGDLDNINLVKGEILPFLAKYISNTKDFGVVRDLISIFTLNFVRYENGTLKGFSQAFRSLLGYNEIGSLLPGVNVDQLEQALLAAKTSKNTAMLDHFVSIIAKGIDGEAGFANKEVFENMLNALLINKSVYMPLMHIMLPADVDGKLFFSEIWVDPNAGEDNGGKENDEYEPVIKLLIKFDIKDMGFFEMILVHKNDKVDFQLYYPESLAPFEKYIKTEMNDIMARNNLQFNMFLMEKATKPKSLPEVFPKIYERKDTINVTV